MGSFTKSEQIVILVIVLAIILALGYKFIIKDIITEEETPVALLDGISKSESSEEYPIEPIENLIIMVHISGQVYNPGLVELVNGDRVIDAVNLAGGLTKEADLDRINLAKKLQDEEKIYIPKIGEINEPVIEGNISINETNVSNSSKIDINLATKDELDKLPGIGPVIAQRIIDYRSSSPFKNIEDLKNVSGIGDKIYNGLKELIRVK